MIKRSVREDIRDSRREETVIFLNSEVLLSNVIFRKTIRGLNVISLKPSRFKFIQIQSTSEIAGTMQNRMRMRDVIILLRNIKR